MNEEEEDYWYKFDSALKSNYLIDAELFARKIDGEWQIAEALLQIARKYSTEINQSEKFLSLLEEAVTFAAKGEKSESLQDSLDSASVLKEIAEEYAIAGNYEEAEKTSNAIQNDRRRKQSFENIANIAKGQKGMFSKRVQRINNE